MEENMFYTAIDTDKALGDILSNFSEDFIENIISESLRYKFRPFNTRIPNHPAILEDNFKGIYSNYRGVQKELIDKKRYEVYTQIIDMICKDYGMMVATDIPEECVYSLAYSMYQIFVSEFTDRMISMFSNYIFTNIDSLVNALPEEKRAIKTSYAKKLYSDSRNQNYVIAYDNLESIIDIIAGLDLNMFYYLIVLLSDTSTADFICSYITSVDNVFTNHFVSYLIDPSTKTDMITSIKLQLVSLTVTNATILNPDTNPCIINDKEN